MQFAEDAVSIPSPNSPASADGRATELSVQERFERKLFGSLEPAEQKPEPQQEEQTDPQQETQTDGETTTTETAPETEFEYEHNGEKFKLPVALKEVTEAHLRHQDYTKKTMEVSDSKKSVELQLKTIAQQQAMNKALAPKFDELKALEAEVKQYEGVDWNALMAQDMLSAQQHLMRFQLLNQKKQTAKANLDSEASQFFRVIHDTQENLKTENEKVLARDVKGWNAELKKSLADAGKTYGFSDGELSETFDARVWKMMNDAHQWQKLQASKPAAIAAAAQKTVKPTAAPSVTGKQAAQAKLRAAIKAAPTDHAKAQLVQQLLESKL